MSWTASTATDASSGGSESCPPFLTRCEAAPVLSSIARNNNDLFDVYRECEEEWQRRWVGCAGGARSAPFFRVNEPKGTDARSAWAHTRGQNPLIINIKCASDFLYMHFINYIRAALLWKSVFCDIHFIWPRKLFIFYSMWRGRVILFRVSTHLPLATRCVSGIRFTFLLYHTFVKVSYSSEFCCWNLIICIVL